MMETTEIRTQLGHPGEDFMLPDGCKHMFVFVRRGKNRVCSKTCVVVDNPPETVDSLERQLVQDALEALDRGRE